MKTKARLSHFCIRGTFYLFTGASDDLCRLHIKLTVIFSQPLHLSPFTLDEFEHAIRHPVMDPPCPLLAEVHSALIYNLRTVPFTRHSAVLSLLRLSEEVDEKENLDEFLGISIEPL